MGANQQNMALKEALEAQEALKLRGFTASCGPTGAVVIDRWSHVRGVWHFHVHSYLWTPSGYSEPTYRTGSIEAAVQYTLETISRL